MQDFLAERAISPAIVLALTLLMALIAAPHAFHLSPWVMVFFFALIGLRLLTLKRPKMQPGRIVLMLLMISGAANVIIQQGIADGRKGGVALLTVMLALKLLEVRSRRDIYITVFLGYFLVITQFLYYQELLMALFFGALVIALTTLLNAMNHAERDRLNLKPLRQTGFLLGLSVPVMVLFFVLFPRFNGPIWGLGLEDKSAVTGLSDQISMGSVSNLSQSDRIAFRVTFENNEIPDRKNLYWRGPVLWHTTGKNWHKLRRSPGTGSYEKLEPAINYRVTLEPSNQPWLFALDLPGLIPENTHLSKDFQLLYHERIKRRFSYAMQSTLRYNTRVLMPLERELALQLPPKVSARLRQQVRTWRAETQSDQAFLERIIRHFNQENYVYTLKPPLLGDEPVDEFFFDSKRGFCEHYAVTFATLARLAGIPARIVTGYQGGEINPVDQHLVVKQADAHAWNEVWLPELGWQRIDPTAAIAPERIERSIDVGASNAGESILFQVDAPDFLSNLYREGRWLFESLDYNWHSWIVNFSRDKQRNLLKNLGLDGFNDRSLMVFAILLVMAVLSLVGFWFWLSDKSKLDPALAAFNRFCQKLERKGLTHSPSEGPMDLCQRALKRFPNQKEQIREIVRLYIAERYGRSSQAKRLGLLKRKVRGLRLG